jgi:pimeloyl-[acyl-carrier protein] synthase
MTAPAFALDPTDPAFRADPYPALRALRERSPLAATARGDWAVTGYALVKSLLRDRRTWSPLALPIQTTPGDNPLAKLWARSARLLATGMHCQPPAEHGRLRRLAMPAFTPARVAARRARIQSLTDARIDRALEEGRVDVTNDLGRPIAMTIAGDVIGMPEEMRAPFEQWSPDLMYTFDSFASAARWGRGMLAMYGLATAMSDLLSRGRGSEEADGLLWSMEQARAEGLMSEDEVVTQAALIYFAAHITTQHLIGNGVLALLRHPDQWQRLCAHPELIEPAVEEFIRYESPVPLISREVSAEIEIAGQTIRPGDRLHFYLAATHRDPAVFDDPDRLDIARSPNPHLGFGGDARYCIGAALARLEAQVVIGTLARRAPRARMETETLEWEDRFVGRGVKSLPLVLS